MKKRNKDIQRMISSNESNDIISKKDIIKSYLNSIPIYNKRY